MLCFVITRSDVLSVLLLSAVASGLVVFVFFLMIRRPPISTLDRSSAASDVYKRQDLLSGLARRVGEHDLVEGPLHVEHHRVEAAAGHGLSLIHISEPTRPY